MTRLTQALAAIDAANAADPDRSEGEPAALLYSQRMSAELARLEEAPSEVLQIAARGQHIERWLLPRSEFPEGRAGYLAWRAEQARRHAARVAGIMADAGYGPAEQARAGVLLRKEGIKRIVAKTAAKMSPEARARALEEFAIPEPFAAAFRGRDQAAR
ncbi:MAG: DUF4202 domain-containing protein [Alphaproteobacteria bacterium HGW-Alphaproteobacteria-2]|nr:MAG: DUF4202 domain-containing protein [Alphaproteobacteria bacterium HGW-Alphaproteobacteria-2]